MAHGKKQSEVKVHNINFITETEKNHGKGRFQNKDTMKMGGKNYS
jgi:hypothetical protein